jgi:hypothetical protein
MMLKLKWSDRIEVANTMGGILCMDKSPVLL